VTLPFGGDVSASADRVVVRFNEAINRRDLVALGKLMTDDHAFVDSSGEVFAGKEEVLRAWDGFFAAFPDYRNAWSEVLTIGGIVVAVGRSVCSTEAALDGPAIWTARTEGDRVSEWRVYDDTPESRTQLGLAT
jgi:ketosteroid isomerase-like protein